MIDGDCLVVFGRAPAAGVGKSRLRRDYPDELVDRLCRAWFDDIIRWPLGPTTSRLLHLDGPLTAAANGCRVVAQPPGDFGERIRAGYAEAFSAGARRVVMVGTDCPTLPAAALAGVFDGLSSADATLVPAVDGGWIALGLTSPLGHALDAVGWSAADTASATLSALRADGRQVSVLPPWYDVDDATDLARLVTDVSRDPGRTPRTAEVLATCAQLF